MARTKLAQSGAMDDAEGARIKARREHLMMGRRELAEMAGVDRGTLTSIEEGGGYQGKTLGKILRALDEAEAEAGVGARPAADDGDVRVIEIELGEGAGRVVVRGPITDRATLEETAARLWALRNTQEPTE